MEELHCLGKKIGEHEIIDHLKYGGKHEGVYVPINNNMIKYLREILYLRADPHIEDGCKYERQDCFPSKCIYLPAYMHILSPTGKCISLFFK